MGRADGSSRSASVSGPRRCDNLEPAVWVVLTLPFRLCEVREVREVRDVPEVVVEECILLGQGT